MRNRTRRVDRTAEYRSTLLAERTRIVDGNPKGPEILVLPGGIAVEDQAPIMHDQFVALRQHRMDHRKLKLTDAALERLDRGPFGICDECGEPISAKRLKTVPWAAHCVPCQDRMDGRDDAETGEALEMIP